MTNPEKYKFPILLFLLVLALALAPFQGNWAILKDFLPILAVGYFHWHRNHDRARAGVGRPPKGWLRCFGLAVVLAIPLYAFEVMTTKPLARLLFDAPKDLSLFDPIKGNLSMLMVYLAFMWPMAAFGEEFIWRGFVLREIGLATSRTRHPWLQATILSATFFGLIHAYQGPRGIFETTLAGLIMGAIYVRSGRSNIWLIVFMHGIHNMISFVAIYFDKYEVINFLS